MLKNWLVIYNVLIGIDLIILLYRLRRSREKNEHNVSGSSIKLLRERSMKYMKENFLGKLKNKPAVIVSDKSHLLFK